MFSIAKISDNLLTKVVFNTAKSRRQTTPNLIKNPRLTRRGYLQPTPKQYKMDIPEDLPNKHLYWNRTEQNSMRRKQYNAHKLYKLGIRPIHENGEQLDNRDLTEILAELSNLLVLKKSLGRTFTNFREILRRFPEVMQTSNNRIIFYAIDQLRERNLSTMTPSQFSLYCYFCQQFKVQPHDKLLIHLYKWIQAESWDHQQRFQPKMWLNLFNYIFRKDYGEQFKDIFWKKPRVIHLFEDSEPQNKPLQDLVPKMFTDDLISTIQKDEAFSAEKWKILQKVPGGNALLAKLSNH